jgi:hypothetical protein
MQPSINYAVAKAIAEDHRRHAERAAKHRGQRHRPPPRSGRRRFRRRFVPA